MFIFRISTNIFSKPKKVKSKLTFPKPIDFSCGLCYNSHIEGKENPLKPEGKFAYMKKSTLVKIVNYLKNVPEMATECEELEAILKRNEEKASGNREAYAKALDIVMECLNGKEMTVAEIMSACENDLPEGMTKGKVQYALTNYWGEKIMRVDNGKSAYKYRVK